MAYEHRPGRPVRRKSSSGVWTIAIAAIAAVAAIWLIWAWVDTDEEEVGMNQDDVGVIDNEGLENEGVIGGDQAAGVDQEIGTQETGEQELLGGQGASIEEIAENPTQYAGQQVSVSGEVGEKLTDRSFTLEGDDPVFDESVLVIDASQMGQAVGENDQLVVSGTVQMFNRQQVETDLGFALEEGVYDEYEGKPVVMAQRVSGAQAARQQQNLEETEVQQ